MTSTTVYEKKIANGETQSYLSEDTVDMLNALKKEKRPAVGPHYVPQRQIGEFAGEEVKKVCSIYIYHISYSGAGGYMGEYWQANMWSV